MKFLFSEELTKDFIEVLNGWDGIVIDEDFLEENIISELNNYDRRCFKKATRKQVNKLSKHYSSNDKSYKIYIYRSPFRKFDTFTLSKYSSSEKLINYFGYDTFPCGYDTYSHYYAAWVRVLLTLMKMKEEEVLSLITLCKLGD
jgi:hypothetical protein